MGWAARANTTPGITTATRSYRTRGEALNFFDAKGERIYWTGIGGVVHRMVRKVRGKSARRADKESRR